MRRTQKSQDEQRVREEAELRQLIWPTGVPQRRSPAQALYPKHRSDAEWRAAEIARRPAQTASKPSLASVIYPNLPTENK